MNSQGVPVSEVTAKDFIMVRAALVKRLGGANEALVWARVHYRCDEDSRVAHDTETGRWWAASYGVIGAEVGLSSKQARNALERLVDNGFLLREQHALRNNYDRVYSYQPVVLPGITDVPSGANGSAPEGEPHVPSGANVHVPSGANVPSIETFKTTTRDVTLSHAVGDDDLYTSDIRDVCNRIAEMVRANGHRVDVVGKTWWAPVERLVRLDGYLLEQVEIVARWATSDEFWATNIRSTSKLRKQFSTLRAQRNARLAKKPAAKATPTARALATIALGDAEMPKAVSA